MAKVMTGAGKRNQFDLGKNHITTHDFGTLLPVDCRLMLPNDEFNIKVSEFTRLMPMPVPTYGKVTSINRCFFVPIQDVMLNFNDFLSGQKTSISASETAVPKIPYIANTSFIAMFTNRLVTPLATPLSSEVTSTQAYDIKIDLDSTTKYYKLTWAGRKALQWFQALGYEIRWDNDIAIEMSALPILCWAKFYLDWIVPSRYLNNYSAVRSMIGINYTTQNASITSASAVLNDIISLMYCYLSDDYFTSCFENELGQEGVPNIDYELSQLVNTERNTMRTGSGTGFGGGSSYGSEVDGVPGFNSNFNSSVITYFTLQSLGVLQALVNKGKLAGTKVQDYLLYTYGIKPSDDALHLSHYLGSQKSVIQIGDVMANASSQGTDIGKTYLGQFAGKGVGGNVDTFKIDKVSQHGYMFITNELQVDSSYTQGIHIEVNALEPEQFQPELDCVGLEPVPFKELAMDLDYDTIIGSDAQDIDPEIPFGFQPTHSAFKFAFDKISGDFRVRSLNTGLDSWYLNRRIDGDFLTANGYSINKNFQQSISDVNRYDQMFQVVGNDTDHFYSIFRIDISAQRSLIPMARGIETDMENRKGHEIDVDLQGHLN